jgi:hypothetical protein
MSIVEKTKTGLDETRLLILGSNILLGFQFNGVFQERFETLAPHAKALAGIALVLMVGAVALLVGPSMRHRLAEQGRVSNELLEVIRVMAGLALWFWYGIQFLQRAKHRKPVPMPSETHRLEPPLATRVEQMLTEARVIIPGAQALLGFQLTIILTKTFSEIPDASKVIHVTALGCMALAVILLMAPAAYHRLVYDGEDNADVLQTGSLFVTTATVPLALGIAGDVYVTIEHISKSPTVAALAAALTLAVLVGLWHVYPLTLRYLRTARARSHRSRPAH